MFARRHSKRLCSTLEQRLRISSALMVHFFLSALYITRNCVRTTTSLKLAIEIFSIRKILVSDNFDKLAFSQSIKFTDDVIFSQADTLTSCPLDANSIITFRAYRRLIVVIRPVCHEKLGWGWAWPFRRRWRFFYRMYQACMWSCSLDLFLLPGLCPPHPSVVAYCNTLKGPTQASTREA